MQRSFITPKGISEHGTEIIGSPKKPLLLLGKAFHQFRRMWSFPNDATHTLAHIGEDTTEPKVIGSSLHEILHRCARLRRGALDQIFQHSATEVVNIVSNCVVAHTIRVVIRIAREL